MKMNTCAGMPASLVIAALAVIGCSQKKTESVPPPQQAAPKAAAPAAELVEYTCTMHPEVRQSEPGKCPKCGMDLVRVETAKQPTQ